MRAPTPPPIELDAAEMAALSEHIRSLAPAELAKIPHDKRRLLCVLRECNRGPFVLDFGIDPWYVISGRWYNLSEKVWFCSKHKAHDRPLYDRESQEMTDKEYWQRYKLGPATSHIKPMEGAR